VILGGVVQFVRPLQAVPLAKDVNVTNTAANPVPVVVENGDADETMGITLAEDVTQGGMIDLDAVDVSGFRFMTFHGINFVADSTFGYRFSTETGKFSDLIPKTFQASCTIKIESLGGGVDCSASTPHQSIRVTGQFLLVQLRDTNNATLQVLLSR